MHFVGSGLNYHYMKVMLHKGLQNRNLTLVWECLYKENRNGLAYIQKETTNRWPRSSYNRYSYFNMSCEKVL